MDFGGFVLCAVLVAGDYGSTHAALKRPGVVEIGPVARHSLPAGAAVKGGACIAGEILGRKQSKKAKIIRRGLQIALTGALVAHNLRQGRK
jgi:hypothetical protein